MHFAIAIFFVVLFVVVFLAVYLLSGLFGKRQPENINLNAPEPTEAEFTTE